MMLVGEIPADLVMIISKTEMSPTLAFYMLVSNCLSLDSVPGCYPGIHSLGS